VVAVSFGESQESSQVVGDAYIGLLQWRIAAIVAVSLSRNYRLDVVRTGVRHDAHSFTRFAGLCDE